MADVYSEPTMCAKTSLGTEGMRNGERRCALTSHSNYMRREVTVTHHIKQTQRKYEMPCFW